jgi:DNA repair exonuclease SbcCD nuclease subunit
MTKYAFIGDMHLGAKSNSIDFIEFQERFFKYQLIPYLLENNIKHVTQVGDIFDTRTNVNLRSLYYAKRNFFDVLEQNGIVLNVILGNHDIFFSDTLEINSPTLLLGEYDNITIHDYPVTSHLGNYSFDFIPWICKFNSKEISEFISKSVSDFCVGHFEISGFAMYKGHIAEEGMSPELFKKYKHVYSGHYHTRSTKGNISYLGTPYEITWQDCDDPRGFYVFDDETGNMEFIENKFRLFEKVIYNDLDSKEFDFESLKDKYIKIIVVNKGNSKKYDSFLQKVYELGCINVTIEENFEEFTNGQVDESVKIEDTLSVVNSYIDSIDVNTDKIELKSLMQKLYIEAIHGEF